MTEKFLIGTLTLCLLLTGCSDEETSDEIPQIDNQQIQDLQTETYGGRGVAFENTGYYNKAVALNVTKLSATTTTFKRI